MNKRLAAVIALASLGAVGAIGATVQQNALYSLIGPLGGNVYALADYIDARIVAIGGGGGVSWPAPGGLVVSNGTASPAGLAPVNGSCALGAGGVWATGACGSGGSLTVGDGTHSVTGTTGITVGPGLVVGGSAGAATLNPSVPNRTSVVNATILASDMSGQVNFNGANLTVTVPAISGTVFAAGMSSTICNQATTALTIATTPTINGYSASTLPAVNGGTASCLGLTSNGTSLDALPLVSNSASTTVASGTSALGTGAITSATCATVVTTTGTGVATTDVLSWGFNGDPSAVTGYVPAVSGMLTIIAYPTANNANFKVCNNTAGSVTPGAITLNWRVVR